MPTDAFAFLFDYGKWTLIVNTGAGTHFKYWDDLSSDDKKRLVTFAEMKGLLKCQIGVN